MNIRVLIGDRWIDVSHDDIYRLSLGYPPGPHLGDDPASVIQAIACAASHLLIDSDNAMGSRASYSLN